MLWMVPIRKIWAYERFLIWYFRIWSNKQLSIRHIWCYSLSKQ
jgi:hypothetical protein